MSAPNSQAEWDAFFEALAAKPFISGIEQARQRIKTRSSIQRDYEEEAEAQGVHVESLLSMQRQSGGLP
jgi:hypothetical protein